jgi:hypothetical protein
VPTVVNPVDGTARVGDYGHPIYPLLVNPWALKDFEVVPDPEWRPVLKSLDCGLVVAYAFDEGGRWSYVAKAVAQQIGHTPETLHEEAMVWLGQVEPLAETGEGRVRVKLPEGKEDLTASLILRGRELVASFGPAVDGTPVVGIGHRVELMICSIDDTDAVDGLRELSQALYSGEGEGKPVSPELYTLDASGAITLLTA